MGTEMIKVANMMYRIDLTENDIFYIVPKITSQNIDPIDNAEFQILAPIVKKHMRELKLIIDTYNNITKNLHCEAQSPIHTYDIFLLFSELFDINGRMN